MPSVKQIIAEIQLSDTLGPNQKVFVVSAIWHAEQRLLLKSSNKPRKVAGAKGLITLEEWEEKNGVLGVYHLKSWADAQLLDPVLISGMIREFRIEMISKGKQYANFRAAFQTYLTKGYLSKKIDACKAKETTTIEKRGISL